jgi:integrase
VLLEVEVVKNRSPKLLPDTVEHFIEHAHAPRTLEAYASDWRDFSFWCRSRGVSALPAEPVAVAEYLAALASSGGAKTTTIRRRVSAINFHHDAVGAVRPGTDVLVRNVVRGIARERRDDVDRADPLDRGLLTRCVESLAGSPVQQARDRVVLCVGFYAALRRSEITTLDVADVQWHPEGMALTITSSKTDQEGVGEVIAVRATEDATCAVQAVREWLRLSGIAEGALVRGVTKHETVRRGRLSDGYVNEIVKAAVARIGVASEGFSGHSMRAGFVTSAREAGIPDRLIMHTTRHRDVRMVATYDRVGEAFRGAVEWE